MEIRAERAARAMFAKSLQGVRVLFTRAPRQSSVSTGGRRSPAKERMFTYLKRTGLTVTVAAAVLASLNCSRSAPDQGSAQVSVQALSRSDIMVVDLVVSGSGISTPLEMPLFQQADGSWRGLLSHIPVGGGRSFIAKAYDSVDRTHRIYSGSLANVDISAQSTADVLIVLQEDGAIPVFTNHAPVVDGVTVSAISVGFGDRVPFTVTAHDEDPGETATLAFSPFATCGVFALPTVTTDVSGHRVWSTLWTAPTFDANCALRVDVADVHGAGAAANATIKVSAAGNTGGGRIGTVVESYPIVTNIILTPVAPATVLAPGGGAILTLLATEPDGQPMTFAWSSDCTGSFGDNTAQSPAFTLAAGSTSTHCTFTVLVTGPIRTGSDGVSKALSTTGSLTVNVGQATATPALGGPIIDITSQSLEIVEEQGSVTLYARAHETNAGATLSAYAWTASGGTFGPHTDAADLSFSQVVWTAPAVMAVSETITLTVTDSQGATASTTFIIHRDDPPVISNIISTPVPPATVLARGASITLDVLASEPYGGVMTYLWSTDCDGSFDDASTRSPVFTLAGTSTATTCTFSVVVSGPSRTGHDGHALILSVNGSLTANVGVTPPERPVGGVVIGLTGQSAWEVRPGDSVILDVTASETNSNATLSSYSWNAVDGSLGAPFDAPDLSYSEIEWIAPSPMPAFAIVTVTVTDSQGATASTSFVILSAPTP